MIMADMLYTPPVCSISMYSISRQNHMYRRRRRKHDFRIHSQCITCCSAYFNSGFKIKIKRKNYAEIKSSCVMPNKFASFELESVSEEGTEGVCENYPQNTFPLWANSLSDQSHSDFKTVNGTKDEEIDKEILSNRIMNLSRSNKARSALLILYRSMAYSDLIPDSRACNSLISCLLRNGKLDDALKMFDLMKKSDVITGHTYSMILKAVAKVRSSDEALRIFEEAEKDEKAKQCIDTIVYNTMITIFGKTNNWVQANRMWRSLKENGLSGTLVTYRLLICVFVRCGQNELALDAYHEMIQSRITPSDDAMQAIIGACAKEGKWDMAQSVFRKMLDSEIKPSLVTCNALINSLGKAGKVKLAFEVYGLMKSLLGYSPDEYTWNALIGALNSANQYTDALRLFERVKKDYGSVLNMHIYNTCLISCQSLGLWERAMKIIWEMENSGLTVSVASYNLVIATCEVARKPNVALQVYDHMVQQKLTPDIFTQLSLMRCCIWGSLWDEVEEILESAPNVSLYNVAIQGMCLRRKTNSARKLYMKMQQIGLKPDGKTRALMLQNLHKR